MASWDDVFKVGKICAIVGNAIERTIVDATNAKVSYMHTYGNVAGTRKALGSRLLDIGILNELQTSIWDIVAGLSEGFVWVRWCKMRCFRSELPDSARHSGRSVRFEKPSLREKLQLVLGHEKVEM